MRARIIALVVVGALAVGLFGVTLLAVAYSTAIASPPDDSGPVTVWTPDPVTTPTAALPSEVLPLPTEADIPANLGADERALAIEWLTWAALVDGCMSDAGFAEYTYSAFWQPGFDPRSTPTSGLDPAASDEHKAAFGLALYGNTGAAADYHWEDAGCAGWATHETGATN